VVYLILLQLLMTDISQVVYASLLKLYTTFKLFFHMQYSLGFVAKDPFYLSTNMNKLYFALN
jgi:hypothetical protein